MVTEIRHRRHVEFAETDMAGIVYFTNVLKWVEAAESALFRQHGLTWIRVSPALSEGWPRVGLRCDFRSPLYFGDEVEVLLRVHHIGNTSITYAFRVERLLPGTPPGRKLAARGTLTTVYARLDRDGHTVITHPVPDSVRAVLHPDPLPDAD